jgi:hypothetical protein
MSATEITIEAEVKQIFIDAGWATAPYMTVKACESGGSSWRRGTPNGMFSIDVWGARSPRATRSRDHMFRTTKTGAFAPATLTKIKEFAEYRLASDTAAKVAEQIREAAKKSNVVTAEQLREYAQAKTGSYYSSYTSQYGGYLTEDSGVAGKFKVCAGALLLNEDQARQYLDLIASFK